MKSINPQTLTGIEAFRSLTLQERQAILPCCRYHHYRANQQVISHREPSCDVYFIISGQAQAIIYSADGRQVTLQTLEAGQMFGELAAIDRQPRTCCVIATTECEMLTMDPADFMATLYAYPGFATVTLKRLTTMVRQLSAAIVERDTLPARQRVRNVVLRLALDNMHDDNTARIIPAPTHADIAHHTGVRRETVSRELADLKKAGFIARQDGMLVIQRVTTLARLVGTA